MIEFFVSALASVAAAAVRDAVWWVCASVRTHRKTRHAKHRKKP